MKRRGQGYPPRIIFTSDFHQLVNGDLLSGRCLLRYDPLRIVAKEELPTLPYTQRPIMVHIRFHPSGELWQKELRFRPAAHLVLDEDPTGQGTMLEAEFPLPPACEEIECWFSYLDQHGQARWDSAFGQNFWLRFATHDLQITRAQIVAQPKAAMDQFEVEIESVPAVETIDVRWRYADAISGARFQLPLLATLLNGRKRWQLAEGGTAVSSDTPLAFDLVYQADGHTFTDDNQGTWYVVSR